MKSKPRTSLTVCGFIVVFLLLAADAKADPIVITFDDVNTSSGTVQIQPDRYQSSGILIVRQADGTGPFVSLSSNTGSNFAFAPRSSPLHGLGDGGLAVDFVVPGTTTVGATNFVSLSVVDGGQATPFQAVFIGRDGVIGAVFGSGNQTVIFSTLTDQITAFYIAPEFPNQASDTGAILGIDNLTFNAPTTSTPEPATMLLFGTGLAGVGAALRRRRKAQGHEWGLIK